MAQSRQTTIAIADIVIDAALYPRSKVNELHVVRLIEVLNSGITLPPILLEQGTNRLVDGRHRTEALQRKGLDRIAVQYRVYDSEAALFAEAVRLNSEHGQPLTQYDIRAAVLKLTELGYERERIITATRISVEKLDSIVRNAAISPTGAPQAIKGGLRGQLSGQVMTPQQFEVNRNYGGGRAVFYIRQLNMLLEGNLWPDSVMANTEMDNLVARWQARGRGEAA